MSNESTSDAAVAWVEGKGGLTEVKRLWAQFGDLLCMEQHIIAGVLGDEQITDREERCAAIDSELDKRLIPASMTWPRFEDGALVQIGDSIMYDGRPERVQGIYMHSKTITLSLVGIYSEKLHTIRYGERVKRAAKNQETK